MEIKTKQLTFPCSYTPEEDRTVKAVISTDSVNRYGFILKSSGMVNDNYRKNPVVLFNHNEDWVIGKSLYEDSADGKIIALPRLNTTAKGIETYNLIKSGDLNGFSVSFDIIEVDDKGEIPIVTKWDLTEYSVVAIPANPEALRLSYNKINDPDIKKYFKLHLDKHDDMELKELSTLVEQINTKISSIETSLADYSNKLQSFEDWKNELANSGNQNTETLNNLKFELNKLSKEFKIQKIENKVLESLLD